jgi:hypothetical protein
MELKVLLCPRNISQLDFHAQNYSGVVTFEKGKKYCPNLKHIILNFKNKLLKGLSDYFHRIHLRSLNVRHLEWLKLQD